MVAISLHMGKMLRDFWVKKSNIFPLRHEIVQHFGEMMREGAYLVARIEGWVLLKVYL